MASEKQRKAARQNVKKAQAGAKENRLSKICPSRRRPRSAKRPMGKDELRRAIARAR
jgi:hypothetical protein